MTPLLAQLYALRTQLDAVILMAEMVEGAGQPQADPRTTCPHCGSSGESQVDRSTLDGTKRMFCTVCHAERVIP